MFSCFFKKKVAKTQEVKGVDHSALSLFDSRDVVRNVFSGYLSTDDHEQMNGIEIFKSIAGDLLEPKIATDKLLNSIKRANWLEMEKVLSKNDISWMLMFKETQHTLADGKQEVITPLKYAVKILDTYSRRLLLEYVPEQHKPLFWAHVREQKEFIDLSSLFQVFANYERLCSKVGSNKEKDSYWNIQHGLEMRKLAYDAQHFLKEMCRERGAWNKQANFHHPKLPMSCKMYDIYEAVYPKIFSKKQIFVTIDDIAPYLGVTFSLLKGNHNGKVTPEMASYDPTILKVYEGYFRPGFHPTLAWLQSRRLQQGLHDIETFQRLLEVRKEDLEFDLVKQASLEAGVVSRPKNLS